MAQTSQGVSPILPTDNSLSVPRHTHTGAEAREEVGLDGGDLRNSNSNDPGLYKSHNPAANSHEESASSSSTLFVTKDTSPTTVPSGDIVPSTISSTNEFSQAHDRLPHSLSSRIPIEIFETVMDVMAYRDLPSAASVSWAWRPRAIHNLYSTIFLDSRKGSSMLVALLRQVPHVKEMLATTSRLVVGHSDGSYRWNLNIDQRYLFVDALPLVFADALPALRVLEFESSLRHSMHPTFYSSLARFKHVRSLHLRHVRLHNTAELRRIVFVFPHLQDLVLHGVTVIHRRLSGDRSQASAYTRFHAKTTPQLQRLEIDPREAHLRCIVDLLVSSGCCASLQHLTTDSRIGDSTSVPNTPQVNRLLQSSGRSLISFHHRDDCYRSRQFAARGYDFDTNAALRHLRLTVCIDPSELGGDWLELVATLRAAFSTIRSHNLERITVDIGIELGQADRLDEDMLVPPREELVADTEELHSVMVLPYFYALQHVVVGMEVRYNQEWHSSEEGVHDAVQALLVPVCRQSFAPWLDRGIVNIFCTASTTGGINL